MDGHKKMVSPVEKDLVNGHSKSIEKDRLNKAKKTLSLGKRLGLIAEDAVVAALAGSFDAANTKP